LKIHKTPPLNNRVKSVSETIVDRGKPHKERKRVKKRWLARQISKIRKFGTNQHGKRLPTK